MNNTLKDLDKVLSFILQQDKKGLETYPEEIADILQPQSAKYVDEILKRLTELGYVECSNETNNYKPSLDGMVFYENSEGMPFQEKGSLGSENDLMNLIKKQKQKPYLFFFLMLVLLTSFVVYKIKLTNKKIEQLEIVNVNAMKLIDSLANENTKLKEDLSESSLKLKKEINWTGFRINKLKAEVKQLSE